MKPSAKTRRGRSVVSKEEREPTVVEVLFHEPVEDQPSDASANLTAEDGANDKNGSPCDKRSHPERIVFRF